MKIIPRQPIADDEVIAYWKVKPKLSRDEIVPLLLGINPFAYKEKIPFCLERKQDVEDIYTLLEHRDMIPQFSIGEPLEFWRDTFKKLNLILPPWLEGYESNDEFKKNQKKRELKELASRITPKEKEAKLKELAISLGTIEKRILEVKAAPYKYSELLDYFKLETWDWHDALLLLAGAYPTGAKLNWDGYDNFLGVHIDTPEVTNVAFIDGRLPDYDVPENYEYAGNEDYSECDKTIEIKIRELRALQFRVEFLYKHWQSASSPHKDRNSPTYYVIWASSKGYKIPWLDFAIKEGLYVPKKGDVIKQEIDKPLSVRTENNYLRLIFSLANSINGFNPNKPYEAAKLIIDETGIENISQQTIADYISKAHNLDSKEKD